jgi:hypothetical protein
MVEVSDLLAGVEIFKQRGAAFACAQSVVRVVDPDALLSRQVSGCPIDPVIVKLLLLCI